jgi:hypothetical protein
MVNRPWQAIIASLLVAAGSCRAPAATVLQDTQSTLSKWVETRQLISRTRADWQADRAMLEQTVAMFQGELASLAEQSETVGTNSLEVARQRAEADSSKAELEAGLGVLATQLAPLETRLRRIEPALPPPLVKTVKSLFDRLPEDPTATDIPSLPRLQTVITLLNEIEKFNSMVTLNPEMRQDPAGGEIKVQVIYLGLAQAWFVDESGDFAGSGVPGADGWVWTPQGDAGSRIKSVIAMYEEKQPAEFVALPVAIQ